MVLFLIIICLGAGFLFLGMCYYIIVGINRNFITGYTKASLAGDLRKTREYCTLMEFHEKGVGETFTVLDAASAVKSVLDQRGTKTDDDLELYQIALETIDKVRDDVIKKVDDCLSWPTSQEILATRGVPKKKLRRFVSINPQYTGEVMYEHSNQDFQNELNHIFSIAQQQGKDYVDVKSGDLHRQVGGYPGPNHRMPVCCDIMKKNMKNGDQILQQPPKGRGATLIIRYRLPR